MRMDNEANPWSPSVSLEILESFSGEGGFAPVGFALLAAGAVLTNIWNSSTPDSATDCVPKDVTVGTTKVSSLLHSTDVPSTPDCWLSIT